MAGKKKSKYATFDDYRRFARDDSLEASEKIGFPTEKREGYDRYIFSDVRSKLKALRQKNKVILDIGVGCGELANLMIENAARNSSKLLLVDSKEMLSFLPNRPFIEKYHGRFPDVRRIFKKYTGGVDAILTYSVLGAVLPDSNIFDFLDCACELLRNGGEMLVGDIPNASKRKRFFSSDAGVEYHKKHTGSDEAPEVDFLKIEHDTFDDGVILGILQRYRNFGFDTYLLPQNDRLYFANRREDILIRRP